MERLVHQVEKDRALKVRLLLRVFNAHFNLPRDPDVARLATFLTADPQQSGQAGAFLPGPCAPYFKLTTCADTVLVSGLAVNRTTAFIWLNRPVGPVPPPVDDPPVDEELDELSPPPVPPLDR